MFEDTYWGDQLGYEYVLTNGNKAPVYGAVQQLRCNMGFNPPC